MKKQTAKLAFAAAVLLGMKVAAQAQIGAEVGIGVNQIYPWGTVGYKGAALDMRNDLNLGQINTYMARVKIELPLFFPNLYMIANPMKFEGTQVRTTSFQYGDRTFSAALPYTTTLKLDHYDLTMFYSVPMLKTATDGILNVDYGINLRVIDFKGEIVQPDSGVSQSKSMAIPVPMGYFALQVSPIDFLEIDGELQGIGYGSNRYVDAIGLVKIKPIPLFFIAGGYSFQNIAVNQSDLVTDLRFGGPVAEIGIQF